MVDTMERININHKNFIEQLRSKYTHTLSSHAFNSLYLWQNEMDLSIMCYEDFFVVKCGMYGANSWLFPCGDEKKIYDFVKAHMYDKSFSMCYLRDSDVKWLESKFPNKWDFKHDVNSDEYICDINEYVSLEGGKFSEVRRKIRKIDSAYDIEVKKLSDEVLSDAETVISKWHSISHYSAENGMTDDTVSQQALREMNKLDIDGIVMYADGEPVSVFAGFALCSDTLDVLIGKCTPDAPKGIAYYALREYLKGCSDEFVYCNHEEDLGIEGIRNMKNSLWPVSKTAVWEAVQI